MVRLSSIAACVTRRHRNSGQSADTSDQSPAAMKACLTTLDLVSLGVGSCLGTGMYLTAGLVASTLTGPSGLISFLLAGAASVLTGVCYAELAGVCPQTSGSAYMYAYITLGELAAFVVGWGLVVEYVIGTAAGAVALSETIDSLAGNVFSTNLHTAATWIGVPKLDLLAAVICLTLTGLLASGAEMSAKVNNALNATNIVVLIFFVVASFMLGKSQNWSAGGFFPFGFRGVLGAIPTCYFAFIGFDTVAATGAEAQDPGRAIPISILLSVLFNTAAYVVVILLLTFDLPFYMLRHDTAMTDVFAQLRFPAGTYVVAIGAISGEFAATFGSMFPLPRVLTAMASDGLIFKWLGKICRRRQTPVRATVLSGLVAMVMSMFFDLQLLIELVLMGTLLAYVLVTFAVLFVRYVPEPPDDCSSPLRPVTPPPDAPQETVPILRRASSHRSAGKSPRMQPTIRRSKVSFADRNESQKMRDPSASQGKPVGDVDEMGRNFASAKAPKDRTKKSDFKARSFNPLFDNSSSEDEINMDSENVLYDRLSPIVSSLISEHTNNPSNRLTNRTSESVFPNVTSQNETETKGDIISVWLGIIANVVDAISASPRRTVCLIFSIYGVEILLCVMVSSAWKCIADGNIILLGVLGLLSGAFVVLGGIISFLPQCLHRNKESFRAPLVPALPVFVALLNIYLMTSLAPITWLLFASWMFLGLLVYFLYGANHSQAGCPQEYIPLHEAPDITVIDSDSEEVNTNDQSEDGERSLLVD